MSIALFKKYTLFGVIFCLLVLSGISVRAQGRYDASVSGFVYDDETGEGLEAVNVYLSNTTFGDATNADGRYEIEGVPAGIHELVVSVVGYEPQTLLISVSSGGRLTYSFNLRQKIYEADAIEVVAADQKEWFRDLASFRKLFLGSSPLAGQCIIKNENVLEFEWPWETRMKANAREPLILINDGLGFRVNCVMIDFSRDKVEEKWSWVVKPHFEELEPESEEQVKIWNEKRREAYEGSLPHFLKSLIDKKVAENGFEIYISHKTSEKVDPLEQYPARDQIVVRDALVPGEKLIQYPHFLKVVYLRGYMSRTPARYQTSWLKLKQGRVTLDEHGYPQDYQPFEVYGYWASLGVADLLPRYYFIDNP